MFFLNPLIFFLKLDFAKAFDNIEGDFVLTVLKGRGMGDMWLSWIQDCIFST